MFMNFLRAPNILFFRKMEKKSLSGVYLSSDINFLITVNISKKKEKKRLFI